MKKQLSSRDEQILLLLKKFDFMTRDQLGRYFKLGKKRNTNRILNDLSNYLSTSRTGYETIYYLNKDGRDTTIVIRSDEKRVGCSTRL